jgi:c-di-GMP-binding flagellar brake protein YcgR
MKTVSLYPSVLMKIPCPHCGYEHQHMRVEPPDADFAFNCTSCRSDFMVKLNVRHFYRKEVNLPCYYTSAMDVDNILDPRIKTGWILDISRSGCAIEFSKLRHSSLDERKGNILLVFFTFPGHQDLFKVQGEVSAIFDSPTHKLKMGVNFMNLDEHQLQRLSVFLMP